MGTTAVRRTSAVLLATLLAVVACYTVLARSARADVRPARRDTVSSGHGAAHRPVVGSGVKFVRNADGSVSRTR